VAQYSVDIVAKALGGAEIDKLAKSFRSVDQAAVKTQKGADGAANGIRALRPAAGEAATGMQGLGAAIQAALGPILAVSTALAVLKKGIDTAFERGAAEQKIRNFTDSAGEYSAALAVASDSARKFGISQTEATAALGDVYGRLKGLGFGLKETSEIYQGFNAIAMQSGTTAEDASGAFLQLSQALGSGKLQGDELRSVLERMPQLGQAIAQSMGVSAAELRKLGQEGKLTSEEIYKALSQAAAGAGELGSKLNEQQSAFKTLGQVSDQLLNSIGEVFGPVVTTGAQLLAEWGQKLADWWGYLGDQVFPKVVSAVEPLRAALADAFKDVDIGAITSFLQNVLIKGFQLWLVVIGNVAKALAGVVNWFKQLSQNPIIQTLVNTMGALVERLGLGGSKVQEWKVKQEEVTQATAATVAQYSSLPPKIDDAKAAAKELKEAQDAVTKAIEASVKAADKLAQKQTTKVDQALQVAQARLQAENAINGVLLEQAQRQLELAQNADQRAAAAQRIYDLTVANAANELKATQLAVAAEIERAQIAAQTAALKAKEVEAVVALAIAQGAVTQAHYEALALQREAVDLAQEALRIAIVVGDQQLRGANAIYKGKVEAAGLAYEQNRVWQATQGAADAAGTFANNMERAAEASASISSGGRGRPMIDFGEAGKNAAFMQEYRKTIDAYAERQRQRFTDRNNQEYNRIMAYFYAMAEKYNQAKAAESMQSSQNEWNKYAGGGRASDAMSRYSGQGGGGGESQVNITYSGNIIRTADGDYVRTSGVSDIVRQAVGRTLDQIRRSPGIRAGVGMR
jgi:tape measure domain-containing protein